VAKDFTALFRDASESEQDRAALAGLLIESLEAEPEPDVEGLGSQKSSAECPTWGPAQSRQYRGKMSAGDSSTG
jgi:hypothetical protein